MATLVPTTNAIMTGQPAYPTAGSLTSTKVPTTPTPTSTSPLPVSTSQQAIQNNNSAQGALNTALVGAQSQAEKKTTSAQQDAASKSPQLASQLAVQAGLNPADVAAYMKANPSVNADAAVGNLLSMPQKQAQPQEGAVAGASSGTVNGGITATGGTMGDASGQQNVPNPVGTNSLLDNEAQRKADLDVLNAKTAKDNQDYLDKIAQVQNGTFPLTPGQQAQIDALKAQFDNLKSAQDLANQNYTQGITRLGIASGRSQYAPELEMGNIKATIDQGIQKLQQLDIQKASAVAQLQGAFETQDFDMVKSAYDVLQRTDAAQTAAINKLHDDTAAALKDTRDFADKLKQENFQNNEAVIKDQLAAKEFDYKTVQDQIDNAFKQQQITETQRKDLADEANAKLQRQIQEKQVSLDYAKFAFDKQQKSGGLDGGILSSNDVKTTSGNQPYVDVSGYKGKDLSTAIAQANQAGVPVVKDAKDASALNNVKDALSALDTLEAQFKELAPDGVVSRFGEKFTRPLSAAADTDYAAKLNAYQTNRDFLFRQINALAGSTPRINANEISAAMSALPKLDYFNTDTWKDGEEKLNLTRRYLTNGSDAILGITTPDDKLNNTNPNNPSVSLDNIVNPPKSSDISSTLDALVNQNMK